MDICTNRQTNHDTNCPTDAIPPGVSLDRSQTDQLAPDFSDFQVLEEEGSHAVYGSRHPARTWSAALSCARAGTVYEAKSRYISIDPIYVNLAIAYIAACQANRTAGQASGIDVTRRDTTDDRARSSSAGAGGCLVTIADVAAADAIYRSPARDRIDSLFLAGATVQYIAQHEHHAESTVTAYMELFFNLKTVGTMFLSRHLTFFGIFPGEDVAPGDLTPRKFRLLVGLRFGIPGLNHLDGIPLTAAERRVIENTLIAMDRERGLIAALKASSRRQTAEHRADAAQAQKSDVASRVSRETRTAAPADKPQAGGKQQNTPHRTIDSQSVDEPAGVPTRISESAT